MCFLWQIRLFIGLEKTHSYKTESAVFDTLHILSDYAVLLLYDKIIFCHIQERIAVRAKADAVAVSPLLRHPDGRADRLPDAAWLPHIL